MRERIQTPSVDINELIKNEVLDLREREGGLMEGHVPLWMIDYDDVPVNHQNILTLQAQIEEEAHLHGTDGQLRPVFLGIVQGRDRLPIIDGYHRNTIFSKQGKETIFSTLQAVSEEELLDKRIQNTDSHNALQFARATKWVRESWALNPYSDRLTETQAFVLGRLRGSNGKGLGLSSDEVEEIMTWIDGKSILWGIEPLTIYSYLHTDDHVDSSLVHNSRPNSSQAEGPRSLPHSTLQRIGKQIPGRTALQLVVAEAIIDHRLGGSGISSILKDVKDLSDEEAFDYISGVDFAAYRERLATEQIFRYRDSEIVRLERVRESSRIRPLDEIAAITGIKIDFILDEGNLDADKMEAISGDLQRIGNLLLEKSVEIDEILQGTKPKQAKDTLSEAERDIKVFTNALADFIVDPANTALTIKTDRQADAVERAITRGRGSTESLDKLRETLEAYWNIKK